MTYKLPPRKLYHAGDRIRWKTADGHHYAGTVLEVCPFLSSLTGLPVLRTRIDTCKVEDGEKNMAGQVTTVEISEIEAACKL